jgi:hypothetical protein
MRVLGLAGYHTRARWPWTQLFLAGCLNDAAMGRPWVDIFRATGKLYETYDVSNAKEPRRYWLLAPQPFSMNVGCLRFFIAETAVTAN